MMEINNNKNPYLLSLVYKIRGKNLHILQFQFWDVLKIGFKSGLSKDIILVLNLNCLLK